MLNNTLAMRIKSVTNGNSGHTIGVSVHDNGILNVVLLFNVRIDNGEDYLLNGSFLVVLAYFCNLPI